MLVHNLQWRPFIVGTVGLMILVGVILPLIWATKFFADALMMGGATRAETGFAPYAVTGPSRSRSAA